MFKNSFFKLNTNRKFNYRPRYLKEKEEQLNYSFNSRIKIVERTLLQMIEIVFGIKKE